MNLGNATWVGGVCWRVSYTPRRLQSRRSHSEEVTIERECSFVLDPFYEVVKTLPPQEMNCDCSSYWLPSAPHDVRPIAEGVVEVPALAQLRDEAHPPGAEAGAQQAHHVGVVQAPEELRLP